MVPARGGELAALAALAAGAAGLLAAAVLLAAALLAPPGQAGPTGGDAPGGADVHAVADGGGPAGAAEEAPSAARAWALGLPGGDRLSALTDGELDALMAAVDAWAAASGLAGPPELECPRAPEAADPPFSETVWLRVAGARTVLECSLLASSGEWTVARLGRVVEGVNDAPGAVLNADGEAEVADAESMRALLGDEAGSALAPQLRAWLGGAAPGEPYLDASGVARREGGLTATVRYGAGGSSAGAPGTSVRASWDEASATWSFEEEPAG